jgi:hypothetical protein
MQKANHEISRHDRRDCHDTENVITTFNPAPGGLTHDVRDQTVERVGS